MSRENFALLSDPLGVLDCLSGLHFTWKPEYGGGSDIGVFSRNDAGLRIPGMQDWEALGRPGSRGRYDLAPVLVEGVKKLHAHLEYCFRKMSDFAERASRLEQVTYDHETRIQAQQSSLATLQCQVAEQQTSLTLILQKNEQLERHIAVLYQEIQALKNGGQGQAQGHPGAWAQPASAAR